MTKRRKTSLTIRIARTLVALLGFPLRLAGAQPADVLLILETKVLLDFRRHNERPEGTGLAAINFTFTILLFLGAGLMIGGFGSQLADPALYTALTSAAVLFFVTLQMITDYTDVLLDATDNAVVGPTPVHGRSLAAARLLHIVIYLGLLVGALSLPMLVFGVSSYGVLSLITIPVTVVLSSALALALTATLYLVILRFARPGFVHEFVLFAQVLGLLLVFGSMQLLPRIVKLEQLEQLRTLATTEHAVQFAVPPMYFAGLNRICHGAATTHDQILALLAVVIPLTAAFLTVRSASRFGESLLALGGTSSDRQATHQTGREQLRGRVRKSGVVAAISDLVTALSLRERGFRLRTLPALGMCIIFTVAILLSPAEATMFSDIQLCMFVYLMALFTSTMVQQARYGDHPEAVWVFLAAPIARPAAILTGFTRSLCLRFLAPLLVLTSAAAVLVGGLHLVPDTIFAALATVILTLLSVLAWGGFVPFSQKFTRPIFSSSIGPFMLFSAAAGVLVLTHAMIRAAIPWAIYGGIAVEIALIALLYRSVARLKIRTLSP